eukprot:TRINITY_DN2404_c0_g1_i1.p1 TRINITY_DN2404_c0_g1~~TRINITY_DN2404_c0_g1_i1.p1  ORF type:complete len:385 (-),score=167.67 TRINITY_DN2404_c0_g1_i1:106-1260(-)
MSEVEKKKRGADRQLTKDDEEDEREELEDKGSDWQEAAADVIAKRRIVKARRSNNSAPEEPTPQPAKVKSPAKTDSKPAEQSNGAKAEETKDENLEKPKVENKQEEKKEEAPKTEEKKEEKKAEVTETKTPEKDDKAGEAQKTEEKKEETKPASSPFNFNLGGSSTSTQTSPFNFNFSTGASTSSSPFTFNFSSPFTTGFSSSSSSSSSASSTSPFSFNTGPVFGVNIPTPLKPAEGQEGEEVQQLEETADDIKKSKIVSLTPQQVVTGEEEEEQVFNVRSKLYGLDKEENKWKERGVGHLKINVSKDKKARLVMRTDASLKLILNSKVYSTMPCSMRDEKSVLFVGTENEGKPAQFLVKFGRKEEASLFLSTVEKHKKEEKDA